MSTSVSNPATSGVQTDWQGWYAARRRRVDQAISEHLSAEKGRLASHSRLPEAVQYSLGKGGKRLRPVLILECCHVCGGSDEAALPAAIAMECVHTFSLIHDDLPAMDDDDLRRGQATNHKVFGEALAILAGDWLMTDAFVVLSSDKIRAELSTKLVSALSQGTLGMIAGQAADVEGESLPGSPELVEYIHAHKTTRLLETCCQMGALCANADEQQVAALRRFGQHLGLAFQISDDLLDYGGSTAALGKRVRKDAEASKQTFPSVFGIEQSRVRARQETEAAVAALGPFGERADRLRGLAQYVITRDR